MRAYIFNRLRIYDVALVIVLFTLFLSKMISESSLGFSLSDLSSEVFIKEINTLLKIFFIILISFGMSIFLFSPLTITKHLFIREGDKVLIKDPKKKVLSSGVVTKQSTHSGYGFVIQGDDGDTYNVPARYITKILSKI